MKTIIWVWILAGTAFGQGGANHRSIGGSGGTPSKRPETLASLARDISRADFDAFYREYRRTYSPTSDAIQRAARARLFARLATHGPTDFTLNCVAMITTGPRQEPVFKAFEGHVSVRGSLLELRVQFGPARWTPELGLVGSQLYTGLLHSLDESMARGSMYFGSERGEDPVEIALHAAADGGERKFAVTVEARAKPAKFALAYCK